MSKGRPQRSSKEVTTETVESLMSKVVAWLKTNGTKDASINNEFLNQVRLDMTSALATAPNAKLACEALADLGWKPNAALQLIMKDATYRRFEVHHRLVKTWVRQECIIPRYRVGAKVTFRLNGGTEQGEVVSVETETAQYVVFCEHLGHVRTGLGNHGFNVDCEDIVDGAK